MPNKLHSIKISLCIFVETGKFLALDLGGTNFRVLLIELGENQRERIDSLIYEVPKDIMLGTGVEVIFS